MPMVRVSNGGTPSFSQATLVGTYTVPANTTITACNIPAPQNGMLLVRLYNFNYGVFEIDYTPVFNLPGSGFGVTNKKFTGPKLSADNPISTVYVYSFAE